MVQPVHAQPFGAPAPICSVEQIAARGVAEKPRFSVPWRPALMQYSNSFSRAAAATKLVQPCMLAAIVARETGGQNIFQIGVPPGAGCGVGLCQVTSGVDWGVLAAPTYPGYGPLLDPNVNLLVAAKEFLEPLLEQFPDSHLAAFAAYNAGPGSVDKALAEGLSPDAWTTNHDYGAAVFDSWINFTAASIGVGVDWSAYHPS
jgi:hypothetical protein